MKKNRSRSSFIHQVMISGKWPVTAFMLCGSWDVWKKNFFLALLPGRADLVSLAQHDTNNQDKEKYEKFFWELDDDFRVVVCTVAVLVHATEPALMPELEGLDVMHVDHLFRRAIYLFVLLHWLWLKTTIILVHQFCDSLQVFTIIILYRVVLALWFSSWALFIGWRKSILRFLLIGEDGEGFLLLKLQRRWV